MPSHYKCGNCKPKAPLPFLKGGALLKVTLTTNCNSKIIIQFQLVVFWYCGYNTFLEKHYLATALLDLSDNTFSFLTVGWRFSNYVCLLVFYDKLKLDCKN